jgi:predicted Rossmann fold flavoprotein
VVKKNIAIIGGGAAGLIAAIAGARESKNLALELDICIFEKEERLGRKLSATGNGRCNLTNLSCSTENYHGAKTDFIKPVLNRFPPQKAIDFFQNLGIICSVEDGDKVYPVSGQATAVLDMLRLAAEHEGVQIFTKHTVNKILIDPEGFYIESQTESGIKTDISNRLILTGGGAAAPQLGGSFKQYQLAQALGHHLQPIHPALVQIKTENTLTRALKGIKVHGTASLYDGDEFLQQATGEILFTEYGFSGPPILTLSRLVSVKVQPKTHKSMQLDIDFLPEYDEITLLQILRNKKEQHGYLSLEYFLSGIVNKKLGMLLIKHGGISPLSRNCYSLSDMELRIITHLLKASRFQAYDVLSWKQAQVTAGGLNTEEFDSADMASKIVPGLYSAGEILDVDGDCGGFNLQWAWASGFIAGQEAVRSLKPTP